MTAEVLIMNKNGVAMAADSAATLTNSLGRGKVYNSANKLFRLSKTSSIGILVYANSSINNIPWELIIKKFRSRTNKTRWISLRECTNSFIQHLNLNEIDKEKSENWYVRNVVERTLNYFSESLQKIIIQIISQQKDVENQEIEINRKVKEFIDNELDTLEKSNAFEGVPSSVEKEIDDKYGILLAGMIKKFFVDFPRFSYLSPIIHKICIKALYKINKWLPYTGIAICGYGDKEFFPGCIVLNAFGVLNGHFLYIETISSQITVEDEVFILPLAQSDVANTFICGMSPLIKKNIDFLANSINQNLFNSLSDTLLNQDLFSIEKKENVRIILKTTLEKYHDAFSKNLEIFLQENTNAITSAVVNLSIPDLAQMAKNLVEMTSFKRKVSLDVETVGGPIDVAVISKGDGFIWIERKHYFKREYNEHFFDGYRER